MRSQRGRLALIAAAAVAGGFAPARVTRPVADQGARVNAGAPFTSIELDSDVVAGNPQDGVSRARREHVRLRLPDSFSFSEDAESPKPHHYAYSLIEGRYAGTFDERQVPDGVNTRKSAWNRFAEYSLVYLSVMPPSCNAETKPEGTTVADGTERDVVRIVSQCLSARVEYDRPHHRVTRIVFPVRVSAMPRTGDVGQLASTTERPGYDIEGRLVISDYRQVDDRWCPFRLERTVGNITDTITVRSLHLNR